MTNRHAETRRWSTSGDRSTLKMSTVAAAVAFLLLLDSAYHADGFSAGPPVGTQPSICYTMTPDHGSTPQTSAPPYVMSVAGDSCYVLGQAKTGQFIAASIEFMVTKCCVIIFEIVRNKLSHKTCSF
jgi:hypothetical protein